MVVDAIAASALPAAARVGAATIPQILFLLALHSKSNKLGVEKIFKLN
jgi:hypothetical protein